MRTQLQKLTKRNSTKSERKIAEIFKRNRIKFLAKWKIQGKEVDFLIGRVILEIDGNIHKHIDPNRENVLWKAGYIPIHISIKEIYEDDVIEEKILNLIKN